MHATKTRVSDVPCMFWLHAHARVTNLILAHTLHGVQHLLHFHLLAFSSLHILWLSHPVRLRHSPASSCSFICPFPPFGVQLVYANAELSIDTDSVNQHQDSKPNM